jgi:GH25 family lysozyme M1 (1,4-beta-N-acetylmuramidase)
LSLASLKAQGYQFVVAKCTEGQATVDAQYDNFRAQANHAGLLFAAYHFLHSDSPASAQAYNLASHIGDKNIPVMIDCEKGGGANLAKCVAFRDELQQRGIRVSLLYLPHSWWQQIGEPSLATWTVVNANYGDNPVGTAIDLYLSDKSTQWDAYGGRTPALLQFGSKCRIDGYPGDLDVNAWRGSLDELKAARLFLDYSLSEVPA